MYARKRFDIEWTDFFAGLGYLLNPGSQEKCEEAIEAHFRPAGAALSCHSVRSGFDLLLGSVDWPRGSEVIMTAVTIPAMSQIVLHHQYIPVPVDIDIGAVQPDLNALKAAIGPKTRAIVAAHLFGTEIDLEPLAKLAHQHGLMLIEDCAQAYKGRPPQTASAAAVSMFSFGTIKTATALGGAVLLIDDPVLREKIRRTQSVYPRSSRRSFGARILKYLLLHFLSLPLCYGLFVRTLKGLGKDYDELIRSMTRNFSGPDFFTAIRHRPCTAQLALLERRLRRYNPDKILARSECGRDLARRLPTNVRFFGDRRSAHTFWLFALIATHPEKLIEALRRGGFDATSGSSTLAVIETEKDSAASLPQSHQAMEQIVYLPLYPEMPASRREEMATIINKATEAANKRPG